MLVAVTMARFGRTWGLGWQAAVALGGALAMSSTAIVVKLMAERLELESEHGRRVMGVLLFQDLAVVPLLVLIPALGSPPEVLLHSLGIASLKAIALLALLAPTSFGQKAGAMSKAQAMAQQLNLTPQQKEKVLPILAAEVPKVQAIKNDNSLSKMQKMQQLRAIHQQSDPQMKAILSPDQYKKLQQIRLQTIREATQGRF